jgi:5-methylcytosine-specific restriction enzyme subunit McrC
VETEDFVFVSGKAHIPIRNLWLLMLYASEFYKSGAESFDGIEDYPEQLPDLLAEILVSSVGDRLKKPLTTEFAAARGDLRRVRGRIDVLRTESHQLLNRGQVACRYEELTVDTPRNRLVLSALSALAPLVSSKELGHACRAQVHRLANLGVSPVLTRKTHTTPFRFSRNDSNDRAVVLAAQLALQFRLPSHERGGGIRRSGLTDHEFRSLFERAVGGFYLATLKQLGWQIHPGRQISWNASTSTPGLGAVLPKMKTDIYLEHRSSNRRIILDTKFTASLAHRQYGGESLKSGHLYQIYTYVRTQEAPSDALSWSAEGLLLYPAVDGMLRESFHTGGHRFTVATVDLRRTASEIRQQLLDIIEV